MNNIEKTVSGTFGLLILGGYLYRLRQLHLRSKCSKIIDLEIDIENNLHR